MARRAVVRDGVTEVELEAPPRSINVVPSVSAEARAALLEMFRSRGKGSSKSHALRGATIAIGNKPRPTRPVEVYRHY